MSTVIVIGAGPSGLMAAYAASQKHSVLLFEKNSTLGKKLSLTGHGRCNITNACSTEDFFKAILSNPKFLYSSFYQFSNQDMIQFLQENHFQIIQEDNGRCFPKSQKAGDVIQFFSNLLQKNNVEIHTNEPCLNLIINDDKCAGIITSKGQYNADTVIVCTGGKSFTQTGSTGDGYIWATNTNIKVQPQYPGLSPILLKEPLNLSGLSLSNIQIKIKNDKKTLYKNTGDILFTHQGISGPMILNASSGITKKINSNTIILIDSFPNLTNDEINQHLLKWIQENPKKYMIHSLENKLPKRWAHHLVNHLNLGNIQASQISKQERMHLVNICKEYCLDIDRIADFNQAMITQGGISTKEIDTKTMYAKKIKGLKFAGEILDVDAQTGGYNLQIAWTTGYVAGNTI